MRLLGSHRYDTMRRMIDSLSLGILGVVQGVTEFLPVSSSGHLILARDVLGFTTEYGLAIDAVLQLATALAVIVYFFKDLVAIVTERKVALALALAVGTVPAVIAGLFLETSMETLFRSSELVAYALIVGSLIMLLAEYLARERTVLLSWREGLVVGLFQCLALVPGMSRSGMTIAGGMFLGLTRTEAARFGFLLAVPILLGSGFKKLAELGSAGILSEFGPALLTGFVVSFVSGLIAIYLLLAIVRRTPLTVFVVYRVALALLILALL